MGNTKSKKTLADPTSPSEKSFQCKGPVGGTSGKPFNTCYDDPLPLDTQVSGVNIWANDLHLVAVQVCYRQNHNNGRSSGMVLGRRYGGSKTQAKVKRMFGSGACRVTHINFRENERIIAIEVFTRRHGFAWQEGLESDEVIVAGIKIKTNQRSDLPWVKREPKSSCTTRQELKVTSGQQFLGFFGACNWMIDCVGIVCAPLKEDEDGASRMGSGRSHSEMAVLEYPGSSFTVDQAAAQLTVCSLNPQCDQMLTEGEIDPLNPPGKWDVFISYSQRHGYARALAEKLYSSLKDRGLRVWLDVNMSKKSTAAMEEGVKNSSCVIPIITGATKEGGADGYFCRPFCISELKWAIVSGVQIQPVIQMEDKEKIGEFLDMAPEPLKFLGNIDFIELKRSDIDYWELGLNKVMKALQTGRVLSERMKEMYNASILLPDVFPNDKATEDVKLEE
jgi:hypothetical protein